MRKFFTKADYIGDINFIDIYIVQVTMQITFLFFFKKNVIFTKKCLDSNGVWTFSGDEISKWCYLNDEVGILKHNYRTYWMSDKNERLDKFSSTYPIILDMCIQIFIEKGWNLQGSRNKKLNDILNGTD